MTPSGWMTPNTILDCGKEAHQMTEKELRKALKQIEGEQNKHTGGKVLSPIPVHLKDNLEHSGGKGGMKKEQHDTHNTAVSDKGSFLESTDGLPVTKYEKFRGTTKEEEMVKKVSAKMRKTPGPQIDNGVITSRGTHRVRWKEKMRGLSLITNTIVLGGRDEANNKSMLESYGITHVLNSCKQLNNFFPESYTYLKICAMDNDSYRIVEDFDNASGFIQRVEKLRGRVLVHCIAGVSRSVCFVLMHLMRAHGICLNQAYKHLKDVRPFIHPNDSFLLQMAHFEIETFGFTSVAGKRAGKDWNFYQWNKVKANYQRGGDEGDLASKRSGVCTIL